MTGQDHLSTSRVKSTSRSTRVKKSRKGRASKRKQAMLFATKRRSWVKGLPGRPPNEKRNLPKAVSHRKREEIRPSDVIHVTVRLESGLPRLRRNGEWQVLRGCFRAALERDGFRLCHYSVMSNHVHLIVEADDRNALSRGMQSLQIRIARRLNKLWQRKGRVFKARYYTEIIRTPAQVRHALAYVLNNARRHKLKLAAKLDLFASGGWFDGWRTTARIDSWPDEDRLVVSPVSWLLRGGWRRRHHQKNHEGLDPLAVPIGVG